MSYFPAAVAEQFERHEKRELLAELEANAQHLHDRRKDVVEYGPRNELTPEKQTRLNCSVLQQVTLHRAERLLLSSGTMLVDKNVYGLALLSRGQIENTSVLGYLCHRLTALDGKAIAVEEFEQNVFETTMGAKHETLSSAPTPTNVLTLIDKADKFLDKEFFEKKLGLLRDNYDWLSEFCHPNFNSNFSAFDLDKSTNRFLMRHDTGFREQDFQLFDYLHMNTNIFLYLFDKFGEKLASADLK